MIILLTLSKMLKERTQKNKNDKDYLISHSKSLLNITKINSNIF